MQNTVIQTTIQPQTIASISAITDTGVESTSPVSFSSRKCE
jgi:hypothetical protein